MRADLRALPAREGRHLHEATIDRHASLLLFDGNPKIGALHHSGEERCLNAGMRTAALFNFEIQHTGLLVDIGFTIPAIARENPGKRIRLE